MSRTCVELWYIQEKIGFMCGACFIPKNFNFIAISYAVLSDKFVIQDQDAEIVTQGYV